MRKFKVGDVCRIRQWDDMAAEFGLSEFGNIPCSATFCNDMRHICGTVFTIKNIGSYYDGHLIYEPDIIPLRCWIITDDMVEPVSDEEEEFEHLDITLDLSLLF